MFLYLVNALAVIAVTTNLHILVNNVVPEPYMDEIFHIPQAQAYCDGNLTRWDPKITTLPGLYLISASVLKFAESIFGSGFGCSVSNLRFINVILNLLNLHLLYCINCIRLKKEDEVTRIMSTLSLGLTPLLYFFSFIYYTDPASTFAVLLMHYTFLKKQYVISPLLGVFAIIMRQTNIVWLIWHGCVILWDSGEVLFLKFLQPTTAAEAKKNKRQAKKSNKKQKPVPQQFTSNYARLSFTDLKIILTDLVRNVVPKAFMYAIVFGMFVTFIILNEGVVVGDKEAHKASINIPQIFYFAIFAMTFGFATVLYRALDTLQALQNNKAVFIFWIIVGLIVVYFNTTAHPYLLADNRHYTFYVWKRLFESRTIFRYILVPVYVAFGFFVTANMNVHPSLVFTFVMVVAVNLVPQKLLEFRYFLLPYLMLRLHMKPSPSFILFIELIWAVVLNVLTIRMYLYNPFTWPHTPETQRFMW